MPPTAAALPSASGRFSVKRELPSRIMEPGHAPASRSILIQTLRVLCEIQVGRRRGVRCLYENNVSSSTVHSRRGRDTQGNVEKSDICEEISRAGGEAVSLLSTCVVRFDRGMDMDRLLCLFEIMKCDE